MQTGAPPSWRPDFAESGPAAAAFAGIVPWVARLGTPPSWPGLEHLSRLAAEADLRNADGLPIRFVEQTRRCGQMDYESGILASGRVPSRTENWHDLFNALAWLAFPRTKAALNRIQCTVLPASDAGRRPPLADAATLFDESGLLLVGPDDGLFDLLRGRHWHEALWARRTHWRQVRVYVVGHALLEKLLLPYPAITAKCLALALPSETCRTLPGDGSMPAWLDRRVADHWMEGRIARPADLFPLPVLGIPGWWPENEEAAFYTRMDIFRPHRPLIPD